MRSRAERKRLDEAYRMIFGGEHDQGELILEDLARVAGVTKALDPGLPSDLLHHYEGRRSLFLHLLHRGRTEKARMGMKDLDRVTDWIPGEERKSA